MSAPPQTTTEKLCNVTQLDLVQTQQILEALWMQIYGVKCWRRLTAAVEGA